MSTQGTTTFPLTGPINLAVKVARGSVTVHTVADATTATVELLPGTGAEDQVGRFTVDLSGPTLTVASPRGTTVSELAGRLVRPAVEVDVVVTVPVGTAVKIETSKAPITLTGRCGGGDIATSTGAVSLGHVDGDLLLRIGHADIRTARVSGSVTVQSGSGEAHFGVIEGQLDYAGGKGLLDVDEVHGPVRARSGSGGARLAAIGGDVDVASGSGPISIGLPAGAAARLDVTSGSGHVRSELPIEDRPAPSARTISVRARTGSGDVRLFRAA